MRTVLRAFVVAAFVMVPLAGSAGEKASETRILLSDFESTQRPSPALLQALREHEERRMHPELRLRVRASDDGWLLAALEAASSLDGL